MSREHAVVPSRIKIKDLARTIGVEPTDLAVALEASGESSQPDDLVDPLVVVEVARTLGVEISIETRDLALERLYELDSRGSDEVDLEGLTPKAQNMITGVLAERESLDNEIEAASEHWTVARMPMIDRTILRIALWQLRNQPGTPAAVVVSEAIRLAGSYSTARSSAFVNGVLAALSKNLA